MTKATPLLSIENDAAQFGFRKEATMFGDKISTRWALKCEGCGAVRTWGWGPKTSPELMVKNARKAEWTIDSRHGPMCQDCRRKDRKMAQIAKLPDPATAAKIARRVYAKLEEVFDESSRVYRGGWTDEKVAGECDTAPDHVTRLRRDAFGELAENPVITSLREDIELARMFAEEAINKVSADAREKIADLERRLAALSATPRMKA
jgi:rhamnose utilization protein RhaD (predicted bifunctional aldolase and dehydrogenase)